MKKLFFLLVVLFVMTCSALAQKKYAVLIIGDLSARDTEIPSSDLWSGGTNESDAFWNDTYLMWEMLQSKGFHPDSIFVLFGDGNDRHPQHRRKCNGCKCYEFVSGFTVRNQQQAPNNRRRFPICVDF